MFEPYCRNYEEHLEKLYRWLGMVEDPQKALAGTTFSFDINLFNRVTHGSRNIRREKSKSKSKDSSKIENTPKVVGATGNSSASPSLKMAVNDNNAMNNNDGPLSK